MLLTEEWIGVLNQDSLGIATLDLSYELMLELQNNSYSRYTILKFVCYTFSEYRSTSKRLKHFTFYKIKSRMSETFPFVL